MTAWNFNMYHQKHNRTGWSNKQGPS